MMNPDHRFIVQFSSGEALHVADRTATVAGAKEATRFDTPGAAVAALYRSGFSLRPAQIVTVTSEGETLKL